MGWLRLVSSLKLQVSIAKEPYKRDYILQKRPIILRSLFIVDTPYAIPNARIVPYLLLFKPERLRLPLSLLQT